MLDFIFNVTPDTERLDRLMATVDEIKATIAAEAAEVKTRLDALQAKIDELTAGGAGATPEQLSELNELVKGIFTPA